MSNYQELASRTLIDKPDFEITDDQVMVVWAAVGLAGEAGEVVDDIKKSIFHQRGLDIRRLSEEIGDLLWYAAALCTELGLDMDDVMSENIEKLRVRYPTGYNPRDSLARVDKEILGEEES